MIFFDGLLPIYTIKGNKIGTADCSLVKAVNGHALSIRVGARRVETLHSALAAERVFSLMSVESVGG